ncbi:MAG: site-2 protease family protein [Chloroflexi bacterium]|nr:site-2 protease family protein [Chloroflexota bacterium]
MIITLLSFFGVLAVLIIAHELGHFITAKTNGVKVEEFGLGFPPRLVGIRLGETLYSLNAIPLGGFVKMAGEEDPKVARSLASKGIGARILILAAGSLMNALLPFLLFAISFMVPHDRVLQQAIVEEVAPGSPAAMAGIRPGDTFLEVNGRPINNVAEVHRIINLSLGTEVTILVKHSDANTETVRLVPRWKPPPGQRALGVKWDAEAVIASQTIVRQSFPFWRAVPMGFQENVEAFILFKNGIISMIIGTTPVAVTGPVGIAQLTGEAAEAGFGPLLEFAAFLSINLAIINILPLPALDGGRIAFVLLEGLRRGRRISPKTEGIVHMIGFALLMAFILMITFQDIVRIIQGNTLLP